MRKFKRPGKRRLATSRVVTGRDRGGGTGRGCCRREGKSRNSISIENILKGYVNVENYNLKFKNTVRDKRHGNLST